MVKVILRIVMVVAALGISVFVSAKTFDDLDVQAITDSLRSLTDAEKIALLSTWLLWIGAQGLQTGSLVRHLPVRRGVVAFLGPAAVASLVPGPSDLPIRHKMLTSWGHDSTESTVALAAAGLFSIGIKLVLPVIAAVGLLLSGGPLGGSLRTIVIIALLVGAAMVAVGFVFRSERRLEWVGRKLDKVWRLALRLLRRDATDDLGTRLVSVRGRAVESLRGLWPMATWGTMLASISRFALLLMALRFTGVPESAISWPQVFVVFALVQGLTVIPITAGDAGVSEVAYIGLLTAAAGGGLVNEVTAGVLLFRLLTWLIIIPIGLITLGGWRYTIRRQAPS